MDKHSYISEQIKKINEAVRLANRAKDIAVEIRKISGSAKADSREADFAEDTLKFYDTSFLQGQVESLRLHLDELKEKLIDIKISNDKLLFAGGYLSCIDRVIGEIFLSNTLCLLQARDQNAVSVMDDAVARLEELQKELEAIDAA